MERCPWPLCRRELGEGVDHPDHRAWARDTEHVYIVKVRPDGTEDVVRVPKSSG